MWFEASDRNPAVARPERIGPDVGCGDKPCRQPQFLKQWLQLIRVVVAVGMVGDDEEAAASLDERLDGGDFADVKRGQVGRREVDEKQCMPRQPLWSDEAGGGFIDEHSTAFEIAKRFAVAVHVMVR